MLDHAKSGDTLLDIGANVGYVSACFLKLIPDGRAVCIEPQPDIVDLLQKNMRQFGARANVQAVALSDEPGGLRFHIDRDNRGASSVRDDGEVVVPAIRAAELLASMEKLDLIKIDVEGHELPIFRDIEAELKRLKPRAIVFEDHGQAAAPHNTIGGILHRCGYQIYGINKKLFGTKLVRILHPHDCRVNDYVALT